LRKLDTDQMKAWRAILSEVAKERPAVASVFEHAAPLSVQPGKISLGYAKQSFLLQQATEQDALELLGRVATSHFGQNTEVMLDESDEHASVQTVAQENSAHQAARVQAARKRVEDHPLVSAAMDILGAELRDVRLPNDFA
jgi:DNA polymerase-3 subunit gamma/tau